MSQFHQDPFRWNQFKGVQHLPKGPAEKWQKVGFVTALAGFCRALLQAATSYAARDERYR
jgi:hypothetical protein